MGGADELSRAHEEPRQFTLLQALREVVRAARLRARREGRPIPGRIPRAVLELPELRRLDHGIRCGIPRPGEFLDRSAGEAHGRRRRRGKQREPRELAEAVEHGDAQGGILAGDRRPVVEQHPAQADERLVDVADLRLGGLLVASDRADEVAPQRRRRHGDPGEPDPGEARLDSHEARAARAHDEHALVLGDEAADRVDDGLGAAGAGEHLHDDGVAGGDLGDDVLLLGVRIEQQGVGLRGAQVLVLWLDGGEPLGHSSARGRVAGERVEDRVVEHRGVGDEPRLHVGERGHDESRLHVEPLEVQGQAAQAVDHGVRLEGAVGLGERGESGGVELDVELGIEGAGELGVEVCGAAQPQLEVAAVSPDGERAQQHGRTEFLAVELPFGDADAEVHGIDAAGGRELDALGGDLPRGHLRRAKREVVADEARQQRRLSRDEHREAAGMGRAEFDARARRVDEVEQR